MAASHDKAVLFARATLNKVTHQWPVAVFNTDKDARSYVAFLKMAYAAGNIDMIKTLDPAAMLDDSAVPLAHTKWSIKVAPYAPSPDFGTDDEDETAPATT